VSASAIAKSRGVDRPGPADHDVGPFDPVGRLLSTRHSEWQNRKKRVQMEWVRATVAAADMRDQADRRRPFVE
jgi:hypothetical protein